MNDTTLVHVTDTNAPPPPAPPQTPAQINAYLDYACEALKRRRTEVIVALENNLASHPTIEDDEVLEVVMENVRIANALSRSGDDRRKQHKEPHLTAGRAVDAWFATWAAPLQRALAPVQVAMNAYGERKLKQQRAQAETARIAAEAEAARLAEVAARALEQGGQADIGWTLDAAAVAAATADSASERATARPAELTRVHGSYGGVASVRETWKWRCTDITKVPAAYLTINEDMINAAAKKRDKTGRPTVVIPGVEFYSETKMGVR